MALSAAPILKLLDWVGVLPDWWMDDGVHLNPYWIDNPVSYVVCGVLGVLILTIVMHLARGIGRVHTRMAKALLVTPAT
jgi:hypothetical protein